MQNDSIQHPEPRLLSDYVNGRMNDLDSAAVEQHLESCTHCCEALQNLNDSALDRLLRSAGARISANVRPFGDENDSRAAEPALQDLLPEATENRYEILAEIGRGGMGVVYRARDRQLRRDVAIKTLQRGCTQPSFKDRFAREARITAALDHPGVPATHELGHFADDRPFMAMRLVKGLTLKSRLEYAPDSDAMLQIFGRLCHCVAFAHSQQIIHRDIKPANVMVGEFGEVQVMDWGLAKHVGETSSSPASESNANADDDTTNATGKSDTRAIFEDETLSGIRADRHVQSNSPDEPQATRAGTVLGTVAYTSPEQARGEVDNIGPASDVFSLGALLGEILTGFPPYAGANEEAVLRSARAGDTSNLTRRLESSTADPALINLTLQCLARSPDARPDDAIVVAHRFDEWQNDVRKRLEDARMAQVRSEAKAIEERKRRRVQLALIATSLIFIVVVWQLYASMRSRENDYAQEESNRRASGIASAKAELKMFAAALDKAIDQPDPDHGEWDEAKIHLTHATDISQKYDDQELVSDLQTSAAEFKRAYSESIADQILLDHLRRLDATLGRPSGGERWLGASASPASGLKPNRVNHRWILESSLSIARQGGQAFADYGFDWQRTSAATAADHIRSRPEWFEDEIVRNLEIWLHFAIVGHGPVAAWVRDLLSHLDPDPFRTEIRSAMVRYDRDFLMDIAQRPDIERQPAEFVWSLAALIRERSHDLAYQLISNAQLNHLDSSVINRDLAHELRTAGKPTESSYALMLRAATQTDPTARANALLELSNSFRVQNRHKEAMTVMRQAFSIQPNIVPESKFARDMSMVEDPEFAVIVLSSMLEEGILVTADPWIELGDALQKQEDWHAAAEAFRKGLAIKSRRESRNEHASAALEQCTSMIAADTELE